MTANALVQARVAETVKEEAAVVLASLSLTVSDAVRLLLTRIAQEKVLPFEPWSRTRRQSPPCARPGLVSSKGPRRACGEPPFHTDN